MANFDDFATEDDLAVAFGEKTAAEHEEPRAGCDEEGYDPCAGCDPCEGCVSQYCKGCDPCEGCEWHVKEDHEIHDADPEDFEPYEAAGEQLGASDKIIMVAAGVLIGVFLFWGWGDPWTLARVVTKAALTVIVVFGAKRLINGDDWVRTFDDRWKTVVVALGSAAIFAFLERHLWAANIGVVLGIIYLAMRKIMPPKVYAAEGDDDESDDDGSDEDEDADPEEGDSVEDDEQSGTSAVSYDTQEEVDLSNYHPIGVRIAKIVWPWANNDMVYIVTPQGYYKSKFREEYLWLATRESLSFETTIWVNNEGYFLLRAPVTV